MPAADDPLARLHARAAFDDAVREVYRANCARQQSAAMRWPRLGGREVDLYILYEGCRALGGIEKVGANRQFWLIRQLMHLPSECSSFATAMRANYQKFCKPFEKVLTKAVEDVYVRLNMHSPEHDWIKIAVGLGENAKVVDSDEEYAECFAAYPEATKAVLRARLNATTLDESEIKNPLFDPLVPALLLLDLRNHIIRLWYRDCSKRLDVYSALRDVPAKYHRIGCAIYTYLESSGVINFGAIPLRTPVAMSFSRKLHKKLRVAVIGAGFAGLVSARQLRSFGLAVKIFEARDRPGGRVHSLGDPFSANIDLGAMLITGVIQNPVKVLADQTGAVMHHLDEACPLFDIDGTRVPKEIDHLAERMYNEVLAQTAKLRKLAEHDEKLFNMSLGEAFRKCLTKVKDKECKRLYYKSNRSLRSSYLQGGPLLMHLETEEMNGSDHACDSPGFESELKGSPGDSTIVGHHRLLNNETSSNESEVSRNSFSEEQQTSHQASLFGNNLPNCRSRLASLKSSKKVSCTLREIADAGFSSSLSNNKKLLDRLIQWHVANLEYACAASINHVSLVHWDQDDPYAFAGDHVLLKTGYKPLLEGLVNGLNRNIVYNAEVQKIVDDPERQGENTNAETPVEVHFEERSVLQEPEVFDAVIITVPLGVLKTSSIEFVPQLPLYKREAIERLGHGGLMKVVMEFESQFWVKEEMFGVLRESGEDRGEFYMFWNLLPCTGFPILIAMVAEPSATIMESCTDNAIIEKAMNILRKCYPGAPFPKAHRISRWATDPLSRGAYTSIPVGSSGADYDFLASYINSRVFFAGEHTCRRNPTTCASAIISGLRAAHQLVQAFGLVKDMAQVHAESLKAAFSSESAPRTSDHDVDESAQQPKVRRLS